MGSWASTGAGLYYTGCEDHLYGSHFLQSCSLCNKPLGFNSDIFMYRGDRPFCSNECRQEQIEMDEARERRKMMKSSNSSSSSKRMTSSSPSSSSARSSRKSDAVAVA